MDTVPVPTSDYINVKNKSNLSFKEMWNREDLSDIKLCCDQNVFRVHRFLLAACSPYFRSLFEKRPDSNLNIILQDVNSDDLRRVLHYMYHGSVMIRNEDIQAFCELLEMFLMSVPEDVVVSASESENETESESECDSEYGSESGDGHDAFVQSVRDLMVNLNEENVQNHSSSILSLTEMEEHRLDVVIDLILESVLQPKPTNAANLFVSLVKHICIQAGTCHFRDDTLYFRENLRLKALRLFASGERNFPTQPEPPIIQPNEFASLNSLDKQIYLMQSIDSHCMPVRYQRLAHFIGHLFQINLIGAIDINGLIEASSQHKNDLFGKNHAQKNCCNFQLPQVVDDICNNDWYQYVSPVENHMFWIRSQVVLGSTEPHKFGHITRDLVIQNESRRQRNQNRKARKERITRTAKNASKAVKKKTKSSQEQSHN
ncbi:uncharacterized protein LOC129577167 [Sitodiplosis mosellana]|uniref:uncharacterized protein LOC129577167 n=1 Tax=Sitodiplosis mosellana TaxID=263140 RepID=UPI002445184A|nr:uncharacterized protein LOC129577167 [Sitodiplosis mosellana]